MRLILRLLQNARESRLKPARNSFTERSHEAVMGAMRFIRSMESMGRKKKRRRARIFPLYK